jgi:sulfite exporter TauE/SafE
MLALIPAIFLASVLGSFHCAGMCGAFLAIASGAPGGGARRHVILQGSYHLGRLVSYTALGAAAGAAGKLINVAGAMAGFRAAAAILAAFTMIAFALITLLRTRGISIGRFGLPPSWLALVRIGQRAALDQPPVVRALMIGLFTTMLPCGWLYAFAVSAAGTGSALRGAMTMTAFWAGTLPALVAVGAGIRGALGTFGRRLPTLTIVAMLVAALYTLSARAALDPLALVHWMERNRRTASLESSSVPLSLEKPACCEGHDGN